MFKDLQNEVHLSVFFRKHLVLQVFLEINLYKPVPS